jgi:predicted RNA-binding protein with RPS1 domain
VVILKISPDQDRISLGMRQILPDPWLTVTDSHHIGDAVSGEVTRLVPFGAFVQLASGIEGIIPLSEISHRRVAKPNDVLEVGDTVQVRIQDIRPEERRMSLSLKALQSPDAEVEYRSAPRGGVSGTDTAGTDGGRKKKDKKRREGSSEGGGDFRAYMRSGNEFGATLGDMFGDMFASSSRSAGGGRRERRRHMEDEDEDLSDITGDDVIEAEALEAESVVEAPTEE